MNTSMWNSHQAARIFVQPLLIHLRACYLHVQFWNIINLCEKTLVANIQVLLWPVGFDEKFDIPWNEIEFII